MTTNNILQNNYKSSEKIKNNMHYTTTKLLTLTAHTSETTTVDNKTLD